jgi:hypothetical protein
VHDPVGRSRSRYVRLAMSVMKGQLQPFALSADRSNETLEILAPGGAHTVCGDLSAITRREPGGQREP